MTEKRYNKSILRVIRTGVIDENNNDLNTDEVVDLLNELHEENKQLKQVINDYGSSDVSSCMNTIFKLAKENEKLTSVNQELRNELKFDEEMYKTFKEIIDEADDLITSHLSKHYQRQWKNFCKHRGVLDD